MVSVLLVIIVLLVGLMLWSRSVQTKLYKGSLEEYKSKIKEAQEKLEDVDQWKKACWDAEKRFVDMKNIYKETDEMLSKYMSDYNKVVNQKKSSEVRTGLIAEQMAPFIGGFPYNPKDAHFLGKPIDFIVFSEDGIHFVEVKSGEARLTDVQRKIRKDIEENKVSFEVFRINGE